MSAHKSKAVNAPDVGLWLGLAVPALSDARPLIPQEQKSQWYRRRLGLELEHSHHLMRALPPDRRA